MADGTAENGMNELMSALARVGAPKAEVVSDAYAGDGLVHLTVLSDGSIIVEIDPYAAEESSAGDVERHLTALVNDASFPKPGE